MGANDILAIILDWFTEYADQNGQRIKIDTDAVARINGDFELGELADYLDDQLNG